MSENLSGRRQNERADLDLLYVNKILGNEPHLARARDISPDGIFLYKLLEPKTEHSRIGLEIMLPGSPDVIWAVGEVVRHEDHPMADGVGVKFVRIAESDRENIRRFVERRAEQANADREFYRDLQALA